MGLLERLLSAFARRNSSSLTERLVYHLGGFLGRRAGPGARRVARVNGARLIVPFDDPALRRLYFTGRFDEPLQAFARDVVRPGDVVVDIGANHGVHTILFGALVGERGKVYAFEPNPTVVAVLRESLALNGWSHVDLRELALSDTKGHSQLRLTPGPATMSSLDEGLWLPDAPSVTVATATLDEELEGVPRARFFKIDAEGWELHVLAGAKTVFAHSPPEYLSIEIVYEAEDDDHVHPVLADWGYELVGSAGPDAFYRLGEDRMASTA
jgi:FkbM family methyltransferase